MPDLSRVLQQYWGYGGFRPLQEEAMRHVLGDRDSLVVLPTGGGKSLCFQAPAIVRDGFAVVVSPLISLMKDQVDALSGWGVPAACLNSSLSPGERRAVVQRVREGGVKVLYVAPERLVTRPFLDFLKETRVAYLAIDEAHCISAWGHDFRPEYRLLSCLREEFPALGVHAFTATATPRVREDIAEQLRLRDPAVLIGSFDRPNLTYRVERRINRLSQVREVIDRHPKGSGIVYCIRRKDVDKLCQELLDHGYQAAPYHAGLSDSDRKQAQEAFIHERVDIIVATVAFGMGIDKSNVRYVVHAGMPKSLEHYQQESGRAGRDGLPSECVLLYAAGDAVTWRWFLERGAEEAREGGAAALRAMDRYCTAASCRRAAILSYFGEHPAQHCTACDLCMGERALVAEPMVLGQKILSCVARVHERFGADYVAAVLSGSDEARIHENGHDSLTTYGILREHSRRAAREWIEQLCGQGFLAKEGAFEVVKITPEGRGRLGGAPGARRRAPPPPRRARRERVSGEEEHPLFEALRELRASIARSQAVPAYMIFSDNTLWEMVRRRPRSLPEFLGVSGVGEKKCREYGRQFLALIAQQLDDAASPSATPKPSAVPPRQRGGVFREEAFRMFREGRSLEEVRSRTGRKDTRVWRYLEDYVRLNHVKDPTPWVDGKTHARIKEIAKTVGLSRIATIAYHLDNRVSEDLIRVSVAAIRNE